jgi:hypothetical protein
LPHFFPPCPINPSQFQSHFFTIQNEEQTDDKANHHCLKIHYQQGGQAMKTAQFTKALTIALHPDVYEEIKNICDAEKISMAQWVRAAVDTALKKEKQKEDTM